MNTIRNIILLILVCVVKISLSTSSSSSSSTTPIVYYPVEKDSQCENYIGDTDYSHCSKYILYNSIYSSSTYNQSKSIQLADHYFQQIALTSKQCNQAIVFQTICSALFPECQTYSNDKDIVISIPVRTCYSQCQQSVDWCNANSYFNCNSTMVDNGSQDVNVNSNSGEIDLPVYPKDYYYYNFEEYNRGILKLQCKDTFLNYSNIPITQQPISPTKMPTETSSEELHYNNNHRSLTFKILISLAVIVPMIIIITLIWYHLNKRSIKKQSSINHHDNNNITINTEQSPLLTIQ